MEKQVKGTEVQVALQGTLETFALADVLRLLASTKKTGTLRIDGDRGDGHMSVIDGELVDAAASGAPLAQRPAEVLFELLRYDSGSFVFDGDADVTEGEHRASVDEALADAEEQLREWREIEAVVPSPTRVVTLVAEPGGKELTFSAKQWGAVVALGTGCTSVELGERLGIPELPATRLVRDLVEMGAATVGDEAATHAPRVEPEPVVEPEPEPEPEPERTIVLDDAPPPPPPPPPPAPVVEEPASQPHVVPPPPPAPPEPAAPAAFQPQVVPDPPAGNGGFGSFADAPSFIDEPDNSPSSGGPLFAPTESSPSAFAPPDAAFAPSPQAFAPAESAFAPAENASPGSLDGWNDDDDDGLSSFHSDDESVPLFSDSSSSPGPDDPFGPDPFTIPSFGSPGDAKDAEDAAELARQLANLSPRAQQAVAAAAAASTDEERDQAITRAEQASDEPINRNLLLKYLSSVDE